MSTDKDGYYAKAMDWASSREKGLVRSTGLAWIIAGGASLIAVAEAFALVSLAPLKSVTPIPMLVDRETGFVQTLNADGRTELRADASLTQSLLAQYVQAREGFNIATVAADYRKVMLWSAQDARNEYGALMPRQNPQSPLRLYPRTTTVETSVKSISPLSKDVYLVRFTTQRHDEGAKPGEQRHWAAVLTYRFVDTPMKLDDRLANPLGFQVVRYHKSEETVAPDAADEPTASDSEIADQPATASPTNKTGLAGRP